MVSQELRQGPLGFRGLVGLAWECDLMDHIIVVAGVFEKMKKEYPDGGD